MSSDLAELLRLRKVWAVPLILFLATIGCSRSDVETKESSSAAVSAPTLTEKALEKQIVDFCGDCHQSPLPDSFPRLAWRDEVRRGYDFYFESGRTDLKPPVQSDVVNYYRDRAPEKLIYTAPQSLPSAIDFTRFVPPTDSQSELRHSVSFVSEQDKSAASAAWWVSDMEHGTISLLTANGDTKWVSNSAAKHPAAVIECDLDGDAIPDLLCTDLGSFLPEDHDRGKLTWIRHRGTDKQTVVTLLSDVGRLADVQLLDLDNDGDEDIAVAEFGWHKTGGIHVLRNMGPAENGEWNFEHQQIDSRPGTIHLRIADLNEDKRPDIVALISQEHELIVGFINSDSGFSREILYTAPDPSYGSSGISLVDLDRDGDEDILYTNGDTFDSHLLKPYHGIAWLENIGELKFQHHRLADLPGVHRALAADLDQDGDLDIAAVALLPKQTLEDIDAKELHSVIWLEQSGPGQFDYHVIEKGPPVSTAMTLSDVDRDGDVDIVAGNFHAEPPGPPIRFFVNGGVKKP